MLEMIPNEKNTAIQFVFTDFFTGEREFVTAFDLEDALKIGSDLVKTIEEIQKKGKK